MLAMNYCPSCTNEMQRVTIAGVAMVQCVPCAGVLVGWSGLEQLFVGQRQQQVECCAALIKHLEGLGSSDATGPVRNYAMCPRCRKLLTARHLGKSVAPFYYCEAHGAMFDSVTLNRLLGCVLTGLPPVGLANDRSTSSIAESVLDSGVDVDPVELGVGILELVVDALTGLLD
jgi:Zn-finger nucleic acid-binding protein